MDAKITYMEEWVHKAHDLLLQYNFRRSLLPTAVTHANVAVRGGLNDLLALSEVGASWQGGVAVPMTYAHIMKPSTNKQMNSAPRCPSSSSPRASRT